MIPGGAYANREFLEGHVRIADGINPNLEAVLFDPQTSGGLLISLPPDRASAYVREATARHIPAVEIGRVVTRTSVEIEVE